MDEVRGRRTGREEEPMSRATNIRKVKRLANGVEELAAGVQETYIVTPSQRERIMAAVARCNLYAREASEAASSAILVTFVVLCVEAAREVHGIIDVAMRQTDYLEGRTE